MHIPPMTLKASYTACRRLTRQSGSNFPIAFLLLPREKRRAMDALYAFMRHSDDLVDMPHPDRLPGQVLVQWRAAFEHALLGCFDRSEIRRRAPGGASSVWLDDPEGQAILPALADTVHRFQIPAEHLRAVLDGVEMDLAHPNYQTFDQLRAYCERVASAVGLACIHVWGFEGNAALEPARSTGVAFQLTNILRDLREDAAADRIYLPLDDLRECGYSIEDLQHGRTGRGFQRLMEMEIDRAETFYRQGSELYNWLKPDGQRIFGVMLSTYRSLLKQIKRHPAEVLSHRVSLGWSRKLRIAARWALFAPSAVPAA